MGQTLTLPPELQGPPPKPRQAPKPPRTTAPLPQPAPRARLKRRHHVVAASFVVCVGLPSLLVATYLYVFALPQYASTVAFSVREEDAGSALDLIGGIADLSGTSSKDTDILFDYIQSQRIVRTISETLPLQTIWTARQDPAFSLRGTPTIEDLHNHWQRKVRVSYDANAGLITVRAIAFQPHHAEHVAQAILDQSKRTINALTDATRQDATRFAKADLDRAAVTLTNVRENLTAFREKHQILDPQTDIAGRLGLLNSLQAQKAQALIDYDLLLTEQTRSNDPRIDLAKRRIEVVETLIAQERAAFGGGEDAQARIIAEYDVLSVDLEFAQTAYVAAKASYDGALADAARTTKYVAAHVSPTRAERSQYPQRFLWVASIAATLTLLWSIALLIYYSVRDRR